jgi:hypothetical protein
MSVRISKSQQHVSVDTMNRIAYLPLVLAVVGGLIGAVSLEYELVFFGVVSGYFVAKLFQSLVWTISGPTETA